jgi:hypothetical protein
MCGVYLCESRFLNFIESNILSSNNYGSRPTIRKKHTGKHNNGRYVQHNNQYVVNNQYVFGWPLPEPELHFALVANASRKGPKLLHVVPM